VTFRRRAALGFERPCSCWWTFVESAAFERALLRRNGDHRQFLLLIGFGKGEEHHDEGEGALNAEVTIVDPKPGVDFKKL
jgi:hypothetical protein